VTLGPSETSGTRYKGLSSSEVEARRRQYGENVLTPPKRSPWWRLFLDKFSDPVIRLLIIATVIAVVVGEVVESIGIIIAILLATTLAFLNEYRAEKEFDIINRVNDDIPTKVIRDQKFATVPRHALVVGDIVLIEMGEEVPIDGRVIEAVCLEVDESRLSGESSPVTKTSDTDPLNTTHAESVFPANRVYRGTMAMDGHGIVEVTAVGDSSEIGKTAHAAAEETEEKTPLNRQLERLSKAIGVVAFTAATLTFVVLVVHGIVVGELDQSRLQWLFTGALMLGAVVALIRVWLPILYDALELCGKEAHSPSWLENESPVGWLKTIGLGVFLIAAVIAIGYLTGSIPKAPAQWLGQGVGEQLLSFFMVAVTLIVVAVPEGLAMSVTLSLAYSMRRMMASNNLVRRMHACETIGAANVICTDKTGTLTKNEMRVHEVKLATPDSKLFLSDVGLTRNEQLIVEAISANSTANLSRVRGVDTKPLGNATEGALLMWLESKGVDYLPYRSNFGIAYQWTFSTERKFMGTMGTSSFSSVPILHVKGAPEIIIERCTHIYTEDGIEAIDGKIAALAELLRSCQERGMRTLAFAYAEAPNHDERPDIDDVAIGMTWLGFVAIADPVRPDVRDAVKVCRDAGIRVKMVTGDNPQTAQEIARQVGLWDDEDTERRHLTGKEFAELPDERAKEAAQRLLILSRARPLGCYRNRMKWWR
jgi:Ca2+-transporting ATPase